MNRNLVSIVVFGSFLIGLFAANASAGGPDWRSLIPFERRVEFDAKKEYWIHQGHGPWMILAASFSGERALPQARELIKELRTRYNLQAYLHHRAFDYNEKMDGKGYAKGSRNRKKMKYYHDGVSQQYVVLVGNFPEVDAAEVERTLQKLKYAWPKSLEIDPEGGTAQNLAFMRELHRRIHTDEDRKRRGPMSASFVTRNPLLPKEYFNPKGIDAFVFSMNKDVEHSLLKNKGRITVKVASFRGKSSMSARNETVDQPTDKLQRAADMAHRLTVALRKKGVEAYEFHDRHESIVTVGSFDRVGDKAGGGPTELLPQIHRIMTGYGAERKKLRDGRFGLMPRSLNGIPFDIQPLPIEVPKRSVAADYGRQLGMAR